MQAIEARTTFLKIVSDDSRHEDGLQLADMVAGAVRQYAWEKFPAYYQTISEHVVDYWLVK